MAATDLDSYNLRFLTQEAFNLKYKKLKLVGTGGMSSVYAYEDQDSGREVAIKELRISKKWTTNDAAVVRGTISEYECLQKLEAIEDIPEVYDLFVIENPSYYGLYLVLELIKSSGEGQITNLEEYVDTQKLNWAFLQRLCFWLLSTIPAIHDFQVVHRDLLLMNILIDEKDNFHLIDFGESFDLSPEARIQVPAQLSESHARLSRDPEGKAPGGQPIDWKKRDIYDVGLLLKYLFGVLRDDWEEKYTNFLDELLNPDPALRADSQRLIELRKLFVF